MPHLVHVTTVGCPAKVEGTWQLGEQEMELQQQFQRFTGQLRYEGRLLAIEQGRIHGTELSFQLNNRRYTGSVEEQTMLSLIHI